MSIDVKPLTPTIGAEVAGVDLRKPLSSADFDALQTALLDHQVLFFRDQPISPDEQVALASRFGEIETHPFGRHLDDHPLVGVLDQTEPRRDGANRWHTDSTFMPRPPKMLILRSVRTPRSGGGDTCWASMTAAYELLSDPIKRLLDGLTASHDVTGPLVRAIQGGHSVGSLEEVRAAWPPRTHPAIVHHPETGKPTLFVNSNFTTHFEGLSEAESGALLQFLFEWVRSPEIQVRFQWTPDAVAIWDNRCTQHFASADYTDRRVMHRVVIEGDWIPSRKAA